MSNESKNEKKMMADIYPAIQRDQNKRSQARV